MGSFIAQELALKNPNRVSTLILYASSFGGNETVLPSPLVIQALETMINSSSPPTQEDIERIISILFPPEWFKTNPNYQNYICFQKNLLNNSEAKRGNS